MSLEGWRRWRARRREAVNSQAEMSFLEHLEELRRVIIFAVVVSLLGACIAWHWADDALRFLTHLVGPVYFKTLTEAFMVKFKVAMAVGLAAVMPLVLHRVWRFIVPALLIHEKRFVGPLVLASVLLFYGGVAFSILVMMPLMVRFFMAFRVPGQLEPVLMVGDYLGFVTKMSLAFGLVFQLPLVVCVLSVAGILDPDVIGRQWRYATVIIFFIGGVATPGTDVISQIALTIPLLVLFFGSVVVSKILVRRGVAREARESSPTGPTGLEPDGPISP